MPEVLIFILFGVLVIAGVIWGSIAARKRREEMAVQAARLGLSFRAGHDRALADGYSFLDKLRRGSNRYAFNIMEGAYQGHRVMVFDYHYETHSHSSKGGTQTHHHYFSFFILLAPHPFPELIIAPESLLSKIAQMVGYEDIDFESAEFSRSFVVRSKDKRFAYDICNPKMMEYLLANRDLTLEFDGPAIAMAFTKRLAPAEIEYNLNRLVRVRSFVPEYLFDKH